MAKTTIPYTTLFAIVDLHREAGEVTLEPKKSWLKVQAASGRKLYIPLGKNVARIDLSFDSPELETAHTHVFGAIQAQVRITDVTPEQALANFENALTHMISLPAVVKEPKTPKAPKPAAAPGEPAVQALETPDQELRRLQMIIDISARKNLEVPTDVSTRYAELVASTPAS